MINLPEETLWQNTALASTYGKGNETRKNRSWNQKQRGILEWREIVYLQVFFCLFQKHLDMSFQLLSTKGHIVFRIGIPGVDEQLRASDEDKQPPVLGGVV